MEHDMYKVIESEFCSIYLQGPLLFLTMESAKVCTRNHCIIIAYHITLGIAFREIVGPVYPAVSLLTGGQRVTLHRAPFPVHYGGEVPQPGAASA